MTHDDLVQRAGRWLKNTQRMDPVFTELGSQMISEYPDAIGFGPHESIVVECKISNSDLNADKRKVFRKYPELGMGNQRFYMFPHDLDIPNKWLLENGWGILRLKGKQIKVERRSSGFQANLVNERRFLRSRFLGIDMEESSMKRALDFYADPERLARYFHKNYERLAEKHDWKTQESCKVRFDDLPEENKKLMLDVCDKLSEKAKFALYK